MPGERIKILKKIEKALNSKVLVYYTSIRRNMGAQMADDVLPYISDQIDKMNNKKKITLILFTHGGATMTSWSIVSLMRNYFEEFDVLTPSVCRSSGTMVCLGADKILMTKKATLGPIDPSINGPLNPLDKNKNTVPVSIEMIDAYLKLATDKLGIRDDMARANILIELSKHIHPSLLGSIYRSKSQIIMIAQKLLKFHKNIDNERKKKVINFLCSESGSHDYPIFCNEAKSDLGLNVEIINDDLYQDVEALHSSICNDLEMDKPFDNNVFVDKEDDYDLSFIRCLVESIEGGRNTFVTDFKVSFNKDDKGNKKKNIIKTKEGWC